MTETQENPAAVAAVPTPLPRQGRTLEMPSRGVTIAGAFTALPQPIGLLAVGLIRLPLAEMP
ncbi:hypothetical protein [Labrys monachus]|uniref:Uncharacterized protein n=1 Tax=Labrys monachus TaxID=217067 RepID=A0ABU0FJ02_9HYPH|nr:hypothetical protein [Labrys monachus]MDQ0394580.1 hypothetical protein [Labrys monachus]